MSIIAFVNQKGGVGKTTTAVNVATAFASIKRRILVIDLDPQGNTSTGLGIDQQSREYNIYRVLLQDIDINDATIKTTIPYLDIITANPNLSAAELELSNMDNREYILNKCIKGLSNVYNHIMIDCPPSLGLLTINALTSADKVLIPMQCDFYSLEGLSHLLKTISLVEKNLNSQIKICGILFTMYDKRNRLTEQVELDVRKCLGDLVFKTTIPRNIRVAEAPSHGQPAIIYDYKSSGSLAYLELMREILSKKSFDNET